MHCLKSLVVLFAIVCVVIARIDSEETTEKIIKTHDKPETNPRTTTELPENVSTELNEETRESDDNDAAVAPEYASETDASSTKASTRKKKSTTTTFCVEIRNSPYEKPIQVCESAGQSNQANSQQPTYSVYGQPSAKPATASYQSAVKTYASPSPSYSPSIQSQSSKTISTHVSYGDAYRSKDGEMSEDVDGEGDSTKMTDSSEDTTKSRSAYGDSSYGSTYGAASSYGGGSGAAPYVPVAPHGAYSHQHNHNGLVITCQPNLAGYAHNVPSAYGAGGAGGPYRSAASGMMGRRYGYGSQYHSYPAYQHKPQYSPYAVAYKTHPIYSYGPVKTLSYQNSYKPGNYKPTVYGHPAYAKPAASYQNGGAPTSAYTHAQVKPAASAQPSASYVPSVPKPTPSAYSKPAAPAYSQPAAPAYSQPAAPAYSQPAAPAHAPTASYSQPAAPAHAPTPTYSQPPATTYSQPESAAYPQPAAPAYSQPSQPAYSPPAAPPTPAPAPAPVYSQPAAPSYSQPPASSYSQPAAPYSQPAAPAPTATYAQPEAPTPIPAYTQPAQSASQSYSPAEVHQETETSSYLQPAPAAADAYQQSVPAVPVYSEPAPSYSQPAEPPYQESAPVVPMYQTAPTPAPSPAPAYDPTPAPVYAPAPAPVYAPAPAPPPAYAPAPVYAASQGSYVPPGTYRDATDGMENTKEMEDMETMRKMQEINVERSSGSKWTTEMEDKKGDMKSTDGISSMDAAWKQRSGSEMTTAEKWTANTNTAERSNWSNAETSLQGSDAMISGGNTMMKKHDEIADGTKSARGTWSIDDEMPKQDKPDHDEKENFVDLI